MVNNRKLHLFTKHILKVTLEFCLINNTATPEIKDKPLQANLD
ncbi:hypothetical protein M622_08990 [Thauera terpenica 58Eu]|uniref:Uncharacterized protein n=1 Tax=Thauera terpenica 58Eu TaxID=1348657 RepID=S9ZR84_9RHOO|nr:hypothetical protein M622_08990 [Thauera terpenica 58Eu]